MTNTLTPPAVNDWLAGYDILPANGPTPGDLDVYASNAFNFLAQPPLLRAVQTIAQPITSSGWAAITYDTVLEANNCTFSGSTFTATVNGWYSINAVVQGNPAAGIMANPGLGYVINGVTTGPWIFTSSPVGAAGGWSWGCYQEVYLNAGDTATVYATSSAPAASFNTTVSVTFPYAGSSTLEIAWLSE